MRQALNLFFLLLSVPFFAQGPVLSCQGDGISNLAAFKIFKSGHFEGLDCGSACNSVVVQSYPAEGDCLEESWLVDGNPAQLKEISKHLFCLTLPGPGEYLIGHTLSFEDADNAIISYEAACSFSIDPCCDKSFDFSIRVIEKSDDRIKFSLHFDEELLKEIKEIEITDAKGLLHQGNPVDIELETSFGKQADRLCVRALLSDGCELQKCIRLNRLPNTLESSKPANAIVKQTNSTKVWPNPADRFLNIDTKDYTLQGFSLTLLNGLGQVQVIKNYKSKSAQAVTQMDISQLESGCYYLYLDVPEKRRHVFKVMIVKSF